MSPNMLNQYLNRHRKIGGAAARRVEKKLGLEHGWMDQPHANEWNSAMASSNYDGSSRSRSHTRVAAAIAARIEALQEDKSIQQVLSVLEMVERLEALETTHPAGRALPLLLDQS